MKLPTRKVPLRLVIFSLSATAVLGIISVLWSGLGETGTKILGSAIAADAASFLALCCTGRVTSAWQRVIQLTGLVSACLGLAAGVYLIWWGVNADGLGEAIGRAAVVLFIVAAASAHASVMLRLRPDGRLARTVVTGTVICTAAAAAVILILDVLGTILILLLHRFGQPRADAVPPGTPARNPSASPPDAKLPSVP